MHNMSEVRLLETHKQNVHLQTKQKQKKMRSKSLYKSMGVHHVIPVYIPH